MRVEVNVCKDDREEEIAKFDGVTIRKETVFRNVSIVNNLKVISEGFWLGGNKEPCHTHGFTACRIPRCSRIVMPVPQI